MLQNGLRVTSVNDTKNVSTFANAEFASIHIAVFL
jgi:hypothetical protein